MGYENIETSRSTERHGPSQCAFDIRHFEYYQGGECLSNAHWLGPWRQHFDDELRLHQNNWKIIGKTKTSGFCVVYSVTTAYTNHIKQN